MRTFRDATDALRTLFELEKEFPDSDVVLVRADRSDDVRLAFRNYFSDAQDFIQLMDEGCAKLSKHCCPSTGDLTQVCHMAQQTSIKTTI